MFKEQFGGGWGSGLIPGIRNNPNIETDDQVEKCQHELLLTDWVVKLSLAVCLVLTEIPPTLRSKINSRELRNNIKKKSTFQYFVVVWNQLVYACALFQGIFKALMGEVDIRNGSCSCHSVGFTDNCSLRMSWNCLQPKTSIKTACPHSRITVMRQGHNEKEQPDNEIMPPFSDDSREPLWVWA